MLLFEPALKASRETSAKFTWQIFTVCSYVVLMICVTDLADLLSETWSFTQQTLFRCCMTLCIMTLVAAIRVSDACCWKPNGNQMETKCKPSGALSWKVSGRFRGTIDVPLLQPFGNPLDSFYFGVSWQAAMLLSCQGVGVGVRRLSPGQTQEKWLFRSEAWVEQL